MNEQPNTSADIAPGRDLAALAAELALSAPAYPADRFSGRGIVICAGGAYVFTNAYVLISVLRRTLGCTLPIEVWHFGPDEISASMAALLDEFDVRLVDALPLIAREASAVRDGWQLKSFAIAHSRFAEVLLLDADQVPVRDPAELFGWPEYAQAGAVFWPDIIELRETNPVWAVLGLAPRRIVSFESGQVLLDKRRHWRALFIVNALNAEAERLYRMIYGDKDAFLVGWLLADAGFALVPHTPFIDERCLTQRDFSGAPLFQHRTNAKWSYAGSQHRIDGFVHLPDCEAALDILRARWNGRVVHLPDRSAAARTLEAELLAAGPLLLEAVTEDAVPLELLPYGEIAGGRSSDRQNWWCEETADGLDFVIADADRVTYRLSRLDRDNWQGRRLRVPESTVAMRRVVAGDIELGAAPGLVDQLLRAAGEDADGQVQLRAALALLGRADPGIRARLAVLAQGSPSLAAMLEGLFADWERREPSRDMVLSRFYHFTGKDD